MKFLLLLIASYVIAFSINLMPAIKHPDLHMPFSHLITSTLLMILLLLATKRGSKQMLHFSLIGALSGVIVFVLAKVEQVMGVHVIVDVVTSIQYPAFFIFIIPLFGLNFLIDLSYDVFSLCMSLFYITLFGITFYFKNK
ncbi:hypothetical protein NC661_10465 [Aquibacillus koreensis]|uniref:Uncharacterized protein n=1 Tax=Aquibacillus koreensis TaxID=279446 RepID=A0A9X4AIA8_9BACI|nr:hypothetical protein [Aquibacillus koreensis]MCT2538266.1 hypothetical protein [Aquibacillus koreensis]MDC3420791.1 hypothetical protein [Aquibacillus koreensis]